LGLLLVVLATEESTTGSVVGSVVGITKETTGLSGLLGIGLTEAFH